MAKQTKAATKRDAVKTENPLNKHGFKFGGKSFTALDVANEAEAVTAKEFDAQQTRESFGKHFILLARTCKSVDDFLSTMGTIEAAKSWTSKQNPVGTTKAPGVWNQTKSNMKVAWEKFGISPDKVETTADLNEKLQAARKAEKETAEKDGTAETVTKAVEEAAKENQSFANLLAKLAELYKEQTDDGKDRLYNALAEVYNTYADPDQAIADLLEGQDMEGVEVQAAAH